MELIIDRFEGKYAILELPNNKTAEVVKSILPKNAKEGDVIEISVSTEKTLSRKKEVEDLYKHLWEK